MVTKTGETREKPRIISEIKKGCCTRQRSSISTSSLNDFAETKISGWIYWKAFPREWIFGWAEVKGGCLFVGPGFRIPLMKLHLQPCKAPRTFKLFRGPETRPFIFRAPTEEEYEIWVKTLAMELIKQTPLVDVPFLDIIGITRNFTRLEKNSTETKKKKNRSTIGTFFSKAMTFREKPDFRTLSGGPGNDLGKKGEDSFSVSVREKKRFFESLNSGKKNEPGKRILPENEKAGVPVPVREMRRFFEPEPGNLASLPLAEKDAFALLDRRRLQRGERKLSKLKIQTAEVEEMARTLARDLETVRTDLLSGSEKEELSAVLIRRLQQENSRLEGLQKETDKVIKENRKIAQKLQLSGKD